MIRSLRASISPSFLLLTAVLLLVFGGVCETVHSQNFELIRKQIRQQQNKTRMELQELQQLLEQYKTEITEKTQRFEELQSTYNNLTREISLRNQVIQKLEDESKSIQQEIQVTQQQYDETMERLNRLKDNYQQTLTYLYKHGRTSELAIFLTSDSFNQVMTRSYYLEKFKEYRERQAQAIFDTQEELKQKEQELIAARERNEKVLEEQQQEKETLREKRLRQEQIITQLRNDRQRLNRLMQDAQDEVNNLNSTLTTLIEREEEARRRAEEERQRRLAEAEAAKKNPNAAPQPSNETSGDSFSDLSSISEAEFSELESSFEQQKGDLPWPVENGVISAKYGNKVHPVYRTKIKNLGVEITTEARSNVYSIHDGVVYGVVPIPGFGDVIIVNHGKYNTVYGNLSEVYVQKNSFIKAGDLIALSGDEDSPKGASVFLMIREQNNNLNPESWIVKK